MTPGTLWLIGCGTMGGAMLSRWIGGGLDPACVTVVDRGNPALPVGVRHLRAPPDGPGPDTLVLAVKPQQLAAIASTGLAERRIPLLISILAGVEEETLAACFDAQAVVRAMPNLPVSIGKGVVALHSRSADAATCAAVSALMAPLGLVEWIDDGARFDAVTALAGSGPGFTYRFIDALASAGAELGLDTGLARRLAIATVEGAGLLAAGADVPPDMLAERVASPGGSTRQGLNVLDRDDALKRLLVETLAATERRNREMAAEARG